MRNDENQIMQQINSIDDNLEKLERNSNRNSDQVGLIWLTILGYIIYLEFIK
jgi:preprotein translocase subunit Sss1